MQIIETARVHYPYRDFLRRIAAKVQGVDVVFVSHRPKPGVPGDRFRSGPWEIYAVDEGLERFVGHAAPHLAARLNLTVKIPT
jgi:hypothetical protein